MEEIYILRRKAIKTFIHHKRLEIIITILRSFSAKPLRHEIRRGEIIDSQNNSSTSFVLNIQFSTTIPEPTIPCNAIVAKQRLNKRFKQNIQCVEIKVRLKASYQRNFTKQFLNNLFHYQ